MKSEWLIKYLCLVVLCGMAVAQAPDTLWTRIYNGPADYDDHGIGCAADSSGNIYVSGLSSNGTDYDYLIIRYNSANGDTIWTRRYNGPVNDADVGFRCTIDNLNNLYVTGYSHNGTKFGLLTIKYNALTGDTIWTKRYDQAGSIDDLGIGVAVDNSGNLYVTGVTYPDSIPNYLTVKYNAVTGTVIWDRTYNGPANGSDIASACALDQSGNLFVTGYSSNGTDYNILTIKYSSAGDTSWTRRISGHATDILDMVYADCATDAAGNVYVTGMCGYYSGSQNRYCVTVKYDPSGTPVWTKFFDTASLMDASMGCSMDNTGTSLYIVGSTYQGPHDHFLIVKYNAANGDSMWYRWFLSSTARTEYAADCAVDDHGYLYVSGTSFDTATFIGNYLTIKLNTGTGVEEAFGRGLNSGVIVKAVPNPFTSYAQIPGHETEDFVLLDVSGRKVGMYKGARIGDGLPRGVFFAVSENKELKPVQVIKIE